MTPDRLVAARGILIAVASAPVVKSAILTVPEIGASAFRRSASSTYVSYIVTWKLVWVNRSICFCPAGHNLRVAMARFVWERFALSAALLFAFGSAVNAEAEAALVLERTIVLDNVSGRIDHMAVDAAGKRLFVAELGNGTVDVVDLQAGKSVGRITNLREPQGVAYIPEQDLIVVASAGDRTVRFYRAADLKPERTVALDDDADNSRIDPTTGNILVGYGDGGLAMIDPKTESKIGDIRLPGHPEAFQVEPTPRLRQRAGRSSSCGGRPG